MMNTPVLFLVFNRPSTTRRVFHELEKVKPLKLYIAVDGPRKNSPTDIPLCNEVKEIVQKITWNCEVRTLFREENLGCKSAVSSAITWFFENEENGIILEDDCLPHPSFFTFCETMLRRYAHDNRVTHIGGANFQKGIKRGDGDYYYSNLTHIWGWASWRRVWSSYDVSMSNWPQFKKERHLESLFSSRKILKNLVRAFDNTFNGIIDTWDYQYFFANLIQNGMSVIPNVNLISNIGYTAEATHPAAKNDEYANMQTKPIDSFKAPTIVRPCNEADVFTLSKDAKSKISLIKDKLLFFRD